MERKGRKRWYCIEGEEESATREDYISIIQASRMSLVFLHEHRYHIFVPWLDTIGMGLEEIRGETVVYTRTLESR